MAIKWKNYQNVLMPDAPPHIEIDISEDKIKELIKKENVYFARWISKWDIEKSCFWYVIKDKKEDINDYKSKIRNQIRKGLKNCKAELIDKNIVADQGYEVYMSAFKRYKTFLKPLTKKEFIESVLKSNDNIDYWGVFYNNKLIAYSQNIMQYNVCNYSVTKFHPGYLKYRPSEALFFMMNQYYLNKKNVLYVSDGARSLSHQTNIQDFLIQKFKFRKAYCKLNIVYRKDIELLVNILFPFRKFIYKSENKIFQKLSVLLKHEEIRRGIC